MKVTRSLLKVPANSYAHRCGETISHTRQQTAQYLEVISGFAREWRNWVLNLVQSSGILRRWVYRASSHERLPISPGNSDTSPSALRLTERPLVRETSTVVGQGEANSLPVAVIFARSQTPSADTDLKKALKRAWHGSALDVVESDGHMKTELAISAWENYLKEHGLWEATLESSWQQLKAFADVRREMLDLSAAKTPGYVQVVNELAQKIQKAIYDISIERPLLLPAGNAHHLILFEIRCDSEDKLHVRMYDKSGYIALIKRAGPSGQVLQRFDLMSLDFDEHKGIEQFVNLLVKSWFVDKADLKKIWEESLRTQLPLLDSIPDFCWGLPQAANDCTLASTAAFLRSWYAQCGKEKVQAIESCLKDI